MVLTLYGLKACDTCRKAAKTLESVGKDVRFHDVRETPLSEETLARFLDTFGEELINRRSTTWRGLSEDVRASAPLDLLSAYPTLMKRPVIEAGQTLTLGWTKAVEAAHLG